MSARQESEYQSLKKQLQDLSIDSEEKAREVLKKSLNNMLIVALVIIGICAIVFIGWPEAAGVTVVFAGLILFWMLNTLMRGQKMIKRYIAEQFSGR